MRSEEFVTTGEYQEDSFAIAAWMLHDVGDVFDIKQVCRLNRA